MPARDDRELTTLGSWQEEERRSTGEGHELLRYVSLRRQHSDSSMSITSAILQEAAEDLEISWKEIRPALGYAVLFALFSFFLAHAKGKGVPMAIGVSVLVGIAAVTMQVAPASANWQVAWWVVMKSTEKLLWGATLLAQHDTFLEISSYIAFPPARTEAWVYIALVPMMLNVLMFFMLSRIARLKLPFIDMRGRVTHEWDWHQALSIGIVCTLVVNIALFLIAWAAIRRAGGILLLTMVVIPLVFAATVIATMWYILLPGDASSDSKSTEMRSTSLINKFSTDSDAFIPLRTSSDMSRLEGRQGSCDSRDEVEY